MIKNKFRSTILRFQVNRSSKHLIKNEIRQNRRVSKRILFHPFTVFILFCIGVLIIGWTYKVVADFYTVTATVPAPVITQGAVITQPVNGQTFSMQLITVKGTCPYGSYVDLFDNNVFSGVAWCLSSGTFSIETDLFVGQNNLRAQDYNITNTAGPATPLVTVYYQPPNVTQPTKPPVPVFPSLLILSSFHFQTFLERQNFSWQLSLKGGLAPFTINVLWGDDQSTSFPLNFDQSFTINHIYNKAGYYPIIVEAFDSAGNERVLQLAALITYPGQKGIYPIAPSQLPPSSPPAAGFSWGKLFSENRWLIVAWPSYLILILMATSYWLGERQEYKKIADSGELKST